jgi:hypothetical protein
MILLVLSPTVVPAESDPASSYAQLIRPVFEQYCFDCHGERMKGDIDLRPYRDLNSVEKDLDIFERVLAVMESREMPPSNRSQPSLDEREATINWLQAHLFPLDCSDPDPGRVTVRRLNRAEYNNTIRDLVGVDFHPADDFPADDAGYGFDNIGDVLSLPPVLLEKYLVAAEKILDQAIVDHPRSWGDVHAFRPAALESTAEGAPYGADGARSLMREGEVILPFAFSRTGEYLLRVRVFGQRAGDELPKVEFRLDGRTMLVAPVEALEGQPETVEHRFTAEAGDRRLSFAYINNFVDRNHPNPDRRDRNLYLEHVELVGPIGVRPLPESHRRIFGETTTARPGTREVRRLLRRFATRAFRRPVTRGETDRLLQLFHLAQEQGDSFQQSVKLSLQAVLVSPHFLFRGEVQPEPDNPAAVHPINEYALASRLSYFLWSSMPDAQLFNLARNGKLRANLETQVERMLQNPRSSALVENFAGQWLQLRNLEIVKPDAERFPDFDDELRRAMRQETEVFFDHLLREDSRVIAFIDADYTFVNERLARHYGILDIAGDNFQRVALTGTHRGGVLTHASILTLTSNPTRTSPVKRGKWVLDNLLGTPPPPPPPDVPELESQEELTGTLRERTEQHRDNPNCISCHERMDPIGFGLEHFDGIGAWREFDGETAIDASGRLVTGESFDGVDEMRAILAERRRDDFVRCLTEKMLTYALGRGLEFYDACAVDQIVMELEAEDYRFSSLIHAIVRSVPFQLRRGDGER